MDNQDKNNQEKRSEILHPDTSFVDNKPMLNQTPNNEAPENLNIKIDKVGTLNLFGGNFPQRMKERYKDKSHHIVLDIVIFFATAIVLGIAIYFVYTYVNPSYFSHVDIKTSGTVKSFEQTELVFDYKNVDRERITGLNLIFDFPEGFEVKSFSPDKFNLETHSILIGDLEPMAHGQVKVNGVFKGEINQEFRFVAVTSFVDNKGKENVETFGKIITLEDSAVSLDAKLSDKIIYGSPFDINITASNPVEIKDGSFKLVFNAPDCLNLIKQSQLTQYSQRYAWPVEFDQDNQYKLDLEAKILGDYKEGDVIKIPVDLIYIEKEKQSLINQTVIEKELSFSKFVLSFNNTDAISWVKPGDSMVYEVVYQNNEDYILRDVEISLNALGSYIASGAGKKNSVTTPALAEIEPGEKGVLEFNIKTLPSLVLSTLPDKKFDITASIVAKYTDPKTGEQVETHSLPTTTKVATNLSLRAEVIYFTPEGDQLGFGPLPPLVGEPTNYWVVVKLYNSNNLIKNAVVTLELPFGVNYTDIYNLTAGDKFEYNPVTRIITWELSEIREFSGIFYSSPEARFQVELVPADSQANTSPALLNSLTVTGVDQYVGHGVFGSGKFPTIAIFPEPELNKVQGL